MKLFNVFRNILAVIAGLIVLSALICLIMNYEPAIVMSGSMEPTFHTGSIVLIDRDSKDDVRSGDAIAFTAGGSFITHRVVRSSEGGYVTKGDANRAEDPWTVATDDVKGKVVLSIPNVGYAIKFAVSAPGLIILVCIIICCGLSALLESVETDRRRKTTSASL